MRPAAGSVTAITIATPAILPDVMNCLAPFSRHPPSMRVAVVRIAAASDPASLSVKAKAPIASPDTSRGSQRACCAALPSLSRPETMIEFWIDTIVDSAPSAAASSIRASAYET